MAPTQTRRRSSSSSRSTRSSSRSSAQQDRTQINTEDISQLEAGRSLVVQMLQEAHGAEAFGATTLQAHIAMTPTGSYRRILERHLRETKDQDERLHKRLEELGATKSLVAQGFGVATTVAGTALSLAKGPVDALRGKAGEEKLFKNAKDEISTEAQEIATYEGIETVARAIGDVKTAELAVSIRDQEQKAFDDLRAELPKLANATVRAIVAGDMSYDVSKTGAAQGLRAIRDEVSEEADEVRTTARRTTRKAAGTTRKAAAKTKSSAKRTAKQADKAVTGSQTNGDLPIRNYDKLNADEITPQLSGLSAADLRKVETYERNHDKRSTVLDRIQSQRNS